MRASATTAAYSTICSYGTTTTASNANNRIVGRVPITWNSPL
jgi:hypothetical protein